MEKSTCVDVGDCGGTAGVIAGAGAGGSGMLTAGAGGETSGPGGGTAGAGGCAAVGTGGAGGGIGGDANVGGCVSDCTGGGFTESSGFLSWCFFIISLFNGRRPGKSFELDSDGLEKYV